MDILKDITSENIAYNVRYLQHIVFDVTDKYNLYCMYCGYTDLYGGYDNRVGKNLPFAKAKAMIDYLAYEWKDIYTPTVVFPLTIGFYGS